MGGQSEALDKSSAISTEVRAISKIRAITQKNVAICIIAVSCYIFLTIIIQNRESLGRRLKKISRHIMADLKPEEKFGDG